MDEILRIETEVCDKDFGRVYSYYEKDEELTGPVPAKPKPFGIYHVVYRSLWDILLRRPIEEVLARNAKKTYDDWMKRKKAEQNRKQYDFSH